MELIFRSGRANLPFLERIAQLSGKTNQFNMTGRKYCAEKLELMLNNPEYRLFSAEYSDKVAVPASYLQ